MSIFLTPIIQEVYDSLDYRQKNVDDRTKTAWFHDRTAWIRMTSMAEVNGNDGTRKDWILQSLDEKHTGGVQLFGKQNKPIPGITSATIQNKGTMGSIREAQVSFVCWDLQQLEMLEIIYMTPGISILLEWGWNKTVKGNLITDNMAQNSPMFDACVAQDAIRRIKNTGGHYDAMQGLITNFNWTARDDGGFDCTTTFSSMSETYMTMSTKSKSKNILRRGVKPSEDEPASFEENILATVFNTIDKIDDNGGILSSGGKYDFGGIIHIDAKGDGDGTDTLLKDKRKDRRGDFFGTGEGDFFGDPSKWLRDSAWIGNEDNYFVTWEFFEHNIVNANLSLIPEKPLPCDTGVTFNKFKTATGEKMLIPAMYNKDTLLNYRNNIISSDPYVCMLPAVNLTVENSDAYYKWDFNVRTDFPETGKIRLADILINMKMIVSAYENSNTINDFVLNILNSVSEACGNIWKFSLFVDEDHPTIIKVVDNLTVESKTPEAFKFKYWHKDSILTSYSLNSEVSNEFKASIMYGVNKQKGKNTPEKDTDGTTEYDFYGAHVKNLAANELRPPEANEFGEFDVVDKSRDIGNPNEERFYEKYLNVAFTDLFEKRTPDTVSAARKALNKYVTEKVKESNVTVIDKRSLILPIKLSVGLPGIAGVKFGNLIDVDYKPSRYTNNIDFQVTNVKQSISDGDWNTEIETIMRVKDNHENFSPYVSSISQEEIDANKNKGLYGGAYDAITR